MLHKFQADKCVFCGVNLAISGYSEHCPARPAEDLSTLRVDDRVECPYCHNRVTLYTTTKETGGGYVMVHPPGSPLNMLGKVSGATKTVQICPICKCEVVTRQFVEKQRQRRLTIARHNQKAGRRLAIVGFIVGMVGLGFEQVIGGGWNEFSALALIMMIGGAFCLLLGIFVACMGGDE